MTLRLTPDLLAAGYEYLRASHPFNKWGLPHSDEIGFRIIRKQDRYGDFCVEGGIPIISISEACIGHTASLLAKEAHEMIHLWQHMTGKRDTHGASFKAKRKQVCASHGFDPLTF